MDQTDGSTLVLLNTNDASQNGFDAPEMAFKIAGDVELSLSDFVL
jgi:hypothetical protein